MWIILTVVCAVAAYVFVLIFNSLVPALLFLAGALVFAGLTWNRRGNRRR